LTSNDIKKEAPVHVHVETPDIVATGISHTGHVRKENEDSIWIDDSGLVLAVADGMGGHERGAEASQTTIKVFQENLNRQKIEEELKNCTLNLNVSPEIECLYTIIARSVEESVNVLYDRNLELQLNKYMGTTVVGLVLVQDGQMLWFHIGDSRLYLWRDSTLKCLTTDHSLYVEWEREGRIGEEPGKNVITRAIGVSPGVEADIEWDKRQEDDIYILCSDGLTDMITDEQIEEILYDVNDVDNITNRLVDAALTAGGIDNVSVVVCKV
jgi:protein phosphatase